MAPLRGAQTELGPVTQFQNKKRLASLGEADLFLLTGLAFKNIIGEDDFQKEE